MFIIIGLMLTGMLLGYLLRRGLHTIGIEAIILTLGGTLGSVIAAWALWKALYKKKGEAA